MASVKRKNSFNTDWENKFDFVKRSKKGDGYFYCKFCQKDYSVESMGVSAIHAHQDKNKEHKQIVEERRKSSTMEHFVQNKKPNSLEFQVAAAEGLLVIKKFQLFK